MRTLQLIATCTYHPTTQKQVAGSVELTTVGRKCEAVIDVRISQDAIAVVVAGDALAHLQDQLGWKDGRCPLHWKEFA